MEETILEYQKEIQGLENGLLQCQAEIRRLRGIVRTYESDTVSGGGNDKRQLIEKIGCTGYMQRFYDFLQGKFHPENILSENISTLSADQAWHVIYCMQEYFGMFDDRFERCKKCGYIFDSYEEGRVIDCNSEQECGTYCEECRPD